MAVIVDLNLAARAARLAVGLIPLEVGRRRGAGHREIVAIACANAEGAVGSGRRRIADAAVVVHPGSAIRCPADISLLLAPDCRRAEFIERFPLADAPAEKLVEQAAWRASLGDGFVATSVCLEVPDDQRARTSLGSVCSA